MKSNPQRDAIDALYRKMGGVVSAAKAIGEKIGEELTHGDLCNWRVRGVPLAYALRISKALRVPPELLNREKVSKIAKVKSWEDLRKWTHS